MLFQIEYAPSNGTRSLWRQQQLQIFPLYISNFSGADCSSRAAVQIPEGLLQRSNLPERSDRIERQLDYQTARFNKHNSQERSVSLFYHIPILQEKGHLN